jgi:hypothetical protein
MPHYGSSLRSSVGEHGQPSEVVQTSSFNPDSEVVQSGEASMTNNHFQFNKLLQQNVQ